MRVERAVVVGNRRALYVALTIRCTVQFPTPNSLAIARIPCPLRRSASTLASTDAPTRHLAAVSGRVSSCDGVTSGRREQLLSERPNTHPCEQDQA